MNYWLMKTEPTTYSIEDLAKEGKTQWEGVRNYQARNFMKKDMLIGDGVLIYHSNCKPPGIVGLAKVCSKPYPDFFALDSTSKYFDPKASHQNPIWWMVDVEYVKTFENPLSLEDIKQNSELENMLVVRKGMRLSIQPVAKQDFETILSIVNNP